MFNNKRFVNQGSLFFSEVINLFIGLILGISFFTFILLIFIFIGNLRIINYQGFPSNFFTNSFELFMSAFKEELWTRLLIFGLIYRKWNFHIAAILSSLIFTILHLFNPGANFFSTLGIFEAGIMFSGIIAYYGSIGLNAGLHWGWNLAQGMLWGLPISGIMKYSENSFFRSELQGNTLLTGGPFGIEAAVPTVLIVGLIAGIFYQKTLFMERKTGSKVLLFTGEIGKSK